MKKNVYSLVLMEEVIKKIDALAFSCNTNRSNMINSILADYVSMVTPHDRMRQIFEKITANIRHHERLQIMDNGSESILLLKSALAFKYNPNIRYALELYKSNRKQIGSLKVSIRTQNPNLIQLMNEFFTIWAYTEKEYIDFKGEVFHKIENGRLERKFVVENGQAVSEDFLGDAITKYVETLDKSIKLYLNTLLTQEELFILYKEYLKNANIIL